MEEIIILKNELIIDGKKEKFDNDTLVEVIGEYNANGISGLKRFVERSEGIWKKDLEKLFRYTKEKCKESEEEFFPGKGEIYK